jgi:hypothetical protein
MHIYVFASAKSGIYGFTPVPDGSNLPAGGAPWTLHSSFVCLPTDGPRIGVSSQAILAGVAERGYHLAKILIQSEIWIGGQKVG